MYQGDLEPFGLGLWYGEGFIYQGGLEPLASAFDTVMGCEYQWDRPPVAEVYNTLVTNPDASEGWLDMPHNVSQ